MTLDDNDQLSSVLPLETAERFREAFASLAALPCHQRVAAAAAVARDAVLQMANAVHARPKAVAALTRVATLCQMSALALDEGERR